MNSVLHDIRSGLGRQTQVIASLTLREIRVRNSRFSFALLFDVLQQLMATIAISTFHTLLGGRPEIGDSIALFIGTGFIPLGFFRSVASRSAAGVRQGRGARALPNVTAIDSALSRGFVESLIYFASILVLLGGFWILDMSVYVIPYQPMLCLEALMLLFAFGIGVALINSAISAFFPAWNTIFNYSMVGQIFLCAIFTVPEYLPAYVREMLLWNPLLHLISLFRSGFYPNYPTHFIDVPYTIIWAASALIIGMAMHRVLRNRLALS